MHKYAFYDVSPRGSAANNMFSNSKISEFHPMVGSAFFQKLLKFKNSELSAGGEGSGLIGIFFLDLFWWLPLDKIAHNTILCNSKFIIHLCLDKQKCQKKSQAHAPRRIMCMVKKQIKRTEGSTVLSILVYGQGAETLAQSPNFLAGW